MQLIKLKFKITLSINDASFFFDPDILRGVEVSLPEVFQQRLHVIDQAAILIAVLSQTAPDRFPTAKIILGSERNIALSALAIG